VSTVTTNAINQAVFDLFVRHQGDQADRYALSAFADPSGAPLPQDWTVVFHDAQNNTVVADTGVMASGESRHIRATVELPDSLSPGTVSIFFAARSSVTGASDMKHDAINIDGDADLQLVPQLSAQVLPGSEVTYRHVLQNLGNITVTDVALTTENQIASWASTLFLDSDGDGTLSNADREHFSRCVTGHVSTRTSACNCR